MNLRAYARFSEDSLRRNRAITPGNRLLKRAAEKSVRQPFRLTPPAGGS
jgi:hypothetical protein